MLLRTIRLAGIATIAVAMLAPAAVTAQSHPRPRPPQYQDRGPYAGDSRDGYDYDRDDRDPRHRRGYRDGRRCDRGAGGSILGAIAGGLLGGAAVGRHGNTSAGALAGAGVGALAGNAIDRDC